MKVKIGILVVLIYCVTLVINLPAAVVINALPNNLAKINNVTGTLWKGKAQKIIINRKLVFNNVKWDINLWALFGLAVEAKASFYNGAGAMSGEGIIRYDTSGIQASDVLLELTSHELLALLPTSLPAKIEGNFSIKVKEAKQGLPYCEKLNGTVVWHDASINSQFGNINLASPVVDLNCDSGAVSAFVTQNSEELSTVLDINLSKGEVYKVNGEIKGTDKLDPSIAQSLKWAGPLNDSGATVIKFEGKL